MRRISLALALFGAVVAAGCSGAGNSGSDDSGRGKGIAEGTYRVTIQNGQDLNPDFAGTINPLAITGGYVTSSPAGIDCGDGVGHTACSATFPLGAAITLTSFPDTASSKILLGWSGDCYGLTSTCSLMGNSDKYIVVQFGTLADRTYHPNRTDPRVHGAEVAAATFTCTQCHGATLQGQGLSVSCAGCHDAAFLAASIQVNTRDTTKKVEQCGTCHASGTYSNAAKHALTGQVVFTTTPVTVAANGTDLEFTVNIKVDGVNSNAFTTLTGGYRYYQDPTLADTVSGGTSGAWAGQVLPVLNKFTRASLTAGTGITVAAPVNGDYLVTLPGLAATVGTTPTTFAARLTDNNPNALVRLYATPVAHANAAARDLVGDQACINCHGLAVFREREANGEFHHGANPQGVESCVVCHTRNTSVSRGMGGDRLVAYVHGIHNSHHMPARDVTATVSGVVYTVAKPDAVYARNDSLRVVGGVPEISSPFSIGFPSYMDNCSNCHDSAARLAAVDARPVTYALCASCHDGWGGIRGEPADHAAYDQDTGCAGCHAQTVLGFHNAQILVTERNGLLWNGQDVSVVEGARISMAITGVSVVPAVDPGAVSSLDITWTATRDGTPVDPCNADFAVGPVFLGIGTANAATGLSTSNMSIIRMYAQANDWVIGFGSSPGQPGSVNLQVTAPAGAGYTSCASNVATTRLVGDTTTAARGVIGLQGKPQIRYAPTVGTSREYIQVRAVSPIREFDPATGALPATQRRQIVSTAKCLACHQGSLYQHGGNRVDSVELCLLCHNPASTEHNVREKTMGVTAAEAYDGKKGQTYDLRTMAHAIHSAGETNKALVFYRTMGIYAFGSQAAIDALPNWKSGSPATCNNAVPDSHGATLVEQYKVYGSLTAGTIPTVDPATGFCMTTLPNSTDGTWKTHNEIVVHYPRALNDCGACHVDGFDSFPSQTVAVAVTDEDTGSVASTTAIRNLLDDVLTGPVTQSCMTCHQAGDPAVQAALRSHAYDFGWTPSTFPNGRQTLIDDATPAP